MKIQLLVVGKLKDPGLRGLCDDFVQRISHYAQIREQELRDDAALLKAVPAEAELVTLQVNGCSLSSIEFASKMQTWQDGGVGKLVFVIGGAEGIPAEVDRRAHFRLSLSTMTLPHRLARLLLLEQIYRSFSIIRNEPYAREG